MHLIDIINKAKEEKRTRFACEILPPLKGEGAEVVLDAIEPLMEFDPVCVNITSHREDAEYIERADGLLERRIVRKRPGTVGIAAAIMKRFGIEAVPHMICGGHSRYDIEDALIDMDFLGMENVLALRGDTTKGERTFKPQADGHRHATGLVKQIADTNRGKFIDGNALGGHRTNFCIGVAGYPEKHSESPNLDTDIRFLKEKVEAGAHYIVTQMCFDNARIFEFIDRLRSAGIDAPVIPGLKPFSTKAQLHALPQIFHVDIPQELVAAVERCKDNAAVREVGIEWATMQARELKAAGIPLIHFYTMSKTDNVRRIVQGVF
jgi:methylenetetrahydrofolate reductase (NADPH)